jgi:hypothetical protein
MHFFEVSALTQLNLKQAFDDIIQFGTNIHSDEHDSVCCYSRKVCLIVIPHDTLFSMISQYFFSKFVSFSFMTIIAMPVYSRILGFIYHNSP